jgi:hypothetical protein
MGTGRSRQGNEILVLGFLQYANMPFLHLRVFTSLTQIPDVSWKCVVVDVRSASCVNRTKTQAKGTFGTVATNCRIKITYPDLAILKI